MIRLRTLRFLVFCLAAFAYLANGAQAHLVVKDGTITLPFCGLASGHTKTIQVDPGVPEVDRESCCGECVQGVGHPPVPPPAFVVGVRSADLVQCNMPERITPRSPLWPGAPPQGPPYASHSV